MEETMLNLRMTTKQLERLSKKAEKEQRVQQAKVKKAIQQRNIDGARIYAENAIRKKNEGNNYLRMAARVDAVQSRVQTAMSMKGVMKNMGSVTKDLERCMASMDLEKVDQIMSQFESTFEDLDVRTSTIEGAMGNATTLSAPDAQVNALIQQVADENGLEMVDAMAGLAAPGQGSLVTEGASSQDDKQQEQLSKRLADLRS